MYRDNVPISLNPCHPNLFVEFQQTDHSKSRPVSNISKNLFYVTYTLNPKLDSDDVRSDVTTIVTLWRPVVVPGSSPWRNLHGSYIGRIEPRPSEQKSINSGVYEWLVDVTRFVGLTPFVLSQGTRTPRIRVQLSPSVICVFVYSSEVRIYLRRLNEFLPMTYPGTLFLMKSVPTSRETLSLDFPLFFRHTPFILRHTPFILCLSSSSFTFLRLCNPGTVQTSFSEPITGKRVTMNFWFFVPVRSH